MTRVLIADDEPIVANAFARLLSSDGHEVETATSGKRAFEMYHSKAYDVIVSDIAMPEMSGVDLLRALREGGSTVPVVLITAVPGLESAMKAVEYGAVRYLPKPVDPDMFRKLIADAAALSARPGVEAAQREAAEFGNALGTVWMAYQPIVSWSKRAVIAYEALVRNDEPALKRPDLLFDRAEHLDRVHDLGRVIRAAIARDVVALPEIHRLFMNLHPSDLRDEELFDASKPLGAFAHRTVLEITERASLKSVADICDRMDRIRRMGFTVAVDDLGAGYAGLASISQLMPDVVKLDMSLIRDIDSNMMNQHLVRSMIEVCKNLGTDVVCEGVETAAERDVLVDLGADLLQGYFFAKPARPFPAASFGP